MNTSDRIAAASAQALSKAETDEALNWLLHGEAALEQKADFLVALAQRGETPEELAAWAESARGHMISLPAVVEGAGDVCGTGGDGRHSFNVSTCVSFVVAACGVPVAKHGNRGVSSKSGSFDVLERLGVPVDLSPEASAEMLMTRGICFLFAPLYHPVFAKLAPIRKLAAARGSRTVFNLLGPMLNPARLSWQLVGVPQRTLTSAYARALAMGGLARGVVVSGVTADGSGMDEASVSGSTILCPVGAMDGLPTEVRPGDYVAASGEDSALTVGSPDESARVIVSLLSGGEAGAREDIVVLNSGLALVAAGKVPDLHEGVALARQAVRSGQASALLQRCQTTRR